MSILSKISKLVKLSEKIDVLSQKTSSLTQENVNRLEKNYELILNSIDYLHKNNKSKLANLLSTHAHYATFDDDLSIRTRKKTDISFQFPKELSAVFDENEEPMLITPPQSPIKSSMGAKSTPPSPSKLKSPTKLPTNPLLLQSFSEGFINSREELTETSLQEARSAEYLERVLNLGKKVKSLITELEQKLQDNKLKMKGSFKTLMNQNGLPYVEAHAEQLLGELFDIIHRDEGTFEQLVKTLSQGLAEKLVSHQYPDILDLLKEKIQLLLTTPTTETSENIQKAFKKIIETELKLTYNESYYDLFKTEYSEFLNDHDLDFHADKFVKLFSDRFMAFSILDVRNKVLSKNPALFSALGAVDVKPENYFELTKESKQLGQHFIQALYSSSESIKVLLHFQETKENTIKKDLIEYLLSQRSEIYNQELIYVENKEQRTYIQSANEEACRDFDSIKLVSWEELSQNIKSNFKNRQKHLADSFNSNDEKSEKQVAKLLSSVKGSYDHIARTFASIPSVSEQNTCISFFPIKFESLPSTKLEHICLVTTSGAVNKLDPENKKNIQALQALQEMIKSFAQQSKPLLIDGIPYTFVYHDEEKGDIDVLLQQINKGLSGTKAPLSSFAPESELVLNDPFRGCAEKKFIDFVRSNLMQSFDSKKMTIMGAANLRMPIIPKKEYSACLNQSLAKLYETCIDFYTTNVDVKKIGEFETAPFKDSIKQMLSRADMKAIKSSKTHADEWKKCAQYHVDMIEKSTSTQQIFDSLAVLNQSWTDISEKINPSADRSKDIDQLYLYQQAELIKNMIAYFSWQQKVVQLKEVLSLMQEKDGVQLSHYSATLGKIYDMAKSRLNNLFLDKINTKGGVQKLNDHCLENYEGFVKTPEEKSEIKYRVNTHCGNMTVLYSKCLKFLKARQSLIATATSVELLQKDIDQLGLFIKQWEIDAKQNIARLQEISISNKRNEDLKKELESALRAINMGLQFIDRPEKKFYSTTAMIQTYTKLLSEAQKVEQDQYICASVIPVTVNYDNNQTATYETNYIDCCCACTANKLPVLTWLTDLQNEKQKKLACFECDSFSGLGFHPVPTKKVLFSNFGFSHSTGFGSPTGLSPLVRSLDLNDVADVDLQQSSTGLPSSEQDDNKPRVAKKLFE